MAICVNYLTVLLVVVVLWWLIICATK